jgi:hypothetical protein
VGIRPHCSTLVATELQLGMLVSVPKSVGEMKRERYLTEKG